MKEELDLIFDLAKESMSNAITHLEKKLMNIRAGKANPNMLSNVTVEYYGTNTPLSQVANINTPDGRTIIIQPWEKSILPEVEKGIEIANLGFNPMNNGENIIINVPALTEERRTELAKQAKTETEETKVAIRNARKEANNEIKKYSNFSEDLKKNSELDIQEITDNYIEKVDKIFKLKQKEIMTL
ncbi:MAG: ribosome recycling factor [Bacteroidota bacterium]|jgi:ribosome recycling factor|nr:ribosome recycling factor [Bacteroidota bacterium]|tara:strand:- start:6250 stop:6807 length:558 start_codon:yes stop_codon:yes gene_type:complete